MKSLMGLLKTHWAGDNFVSVLGVLRYFRTAICKACVEATSEASIARDEAFYSFNGKLGAAI